MAWPVPEVAEPTQETLMQWADENGCQATDGCWLADGVSECPHGHPSWAVVLGFVPPESGD